MQSILRRHTQGVFYGGDGKHAVRPAHVSAEQQGRVRQIKWGGSVP